MKIQNNVQPENRIPLNERDVQRRWLLTLSVPLLSALALSGCASRMKRELDFPKPPKQGGSQRDGKATLLALLLAFLVGLAAPMPAVRAQDTAPSANVTPIVTPDVIPAVNLAPPDATTLPAIRTISAGVRVVVMLLEEVRSGRAKGGDVLRFMVRDDVRSPDGRLLIPARTPAAGKVIQSSRAGAFGRPGKIAVACDRLLPERDGKPILVAGVGTVAVIGSLWRGGEATLRPGATFAVMVTEETIVGPPSADLSPIKQ